MDMESKMKQSKVVVKKIVIFVLVTVLCSFAVFGLYSMEPVKEVKPKESAVLKTVTFQMLKPVSDSFNVTVYGESYPRWSTVVRTQVDGEIKYISDKLQSGGSVVKAGERLIEIEKSLYEVAANEAELRLKNAELRLLEEEQRAKQAKADWADSGLDGEPSSELVFHEPQLLVAKAEMKAAKAALDKARLDLQKTVIRAPFNGRISERSASIGGTVFAGDEVFKIISDDDVEVGVSINSMQEASLGGVENSLVRIVNPSTGGDEWSGSIVRSDGAFDSRTRMKKILYQT